MKCRKCNEDKPDAGFGHCFECLSSPKVSDSKDSEWNAECIKWRGKVLTGSKAHYCWDWDGLPVDETCAEFGCCSCYSEEEQIVTTSV